MNFLAHFYLSDNTPEGFVGGLLGDFVRGDFRGKFSETIEREIEIHRSIDSFTDTHAIVKQSKQRVSASRKKYAGVLIDMFYDHFLAVVFESYAGVAIEEFSAKVYRALSESETYLPAELYARIAWIHEHSLLNSYVRIEGIGRALYGISRRLKRENPLPEGIFDLKNNYDDLRKDFEIFFPNLIEFVAEERKRFEPNKNNSPSL